MKFLLPILFLIGCTKGDIGCKVQDTLVGAGTSAIAMSLKCTGTEAIKADLNKLVGKLGICKKDQTQMKMAFVCPLLVSLVKDQLNGIVPSAWACDITATQDKIAEALTAACEKVL